ncbi:MAG: ferrous iron transport protein B [Fimbriimonadaceae bacterium]|nr:ferrous iron transport protein B [Fimbriimonadaceae bacterium]
MSDCHGTSTATVRDVRQPLVAIAGNPNAGKTTLFNALTGSHQKVGNYPGVTVESVTGTLRLDGKEIAAVDVPGLYSIDAVSEDELVAVDVLKGTIPGSRRPDLIVYVMDAGNLERNLFFFSQLAEADFPIVVALTMTDLIEQSGGTVDVQKLSNLLGVDVIPVVAHKKKGMRELFEAIERNIAEPRHANCEIGFPIQLETKVAALKERLARSGLDYGKFEIRQALLGNNPGLFEDLAELQELEEAVHHAKDELATENLNQPTLDLTSRYNWAAMVKLAVISDEGHKPMRSLTDRIDNILTHRVFGVMVFIGVMYLVFQSIYTLAGPLMTVIEDVIGGLSDLVAGWVTGAPDWVQSLIVKGLIGGVGAMLVFLPQILILFLFISILEGTGYLARAAFLMDRLLGWCGLSGRAFIPLLSSFACAIPGIMAARVMPDQKSRLATILVAPLMSCSARLPVYLLLIGAFIEPKYGPAWAGFTLFAMHFLGLIVAVPIVWLLNRGVIKGKRLPFVLELPPYQWPKWRDVWLAIYFRGKLFVTTAGTIIVALSIVIWATLYFPRSEDTAARFEAAYVTAYPDATESEISHHVEGKLMEQSLLGRFGKTIEPAFAPAGFDWRLSTAILSAFPAREVVVSSMGIIFNLGEEQDETSTDLRDAIQKATWPDGRPLVTLWSTISLMVFFALCCQCMATLATVKRETNSWKWPLFMFVYMSGLAYIFSVAIYQFGLWIGG